MKIFKEKPVKTIEHFGVRVTVAQELLEPNDNWYKENTYLYQRIWWTVAGFVSDVYYGSRMKRVKK